MLIIVAKKHYETTGVIINAMVVVSGMIVCENCADLCGETERCDWIRNYSCSIDTFGLLL